MANDDQRKVSVETYEACVDIFFERFVENKRGFPLFIKFLTEVFFFSLFDCSDESSF